MAVHRRRAQQIEQADAADFPAEPAQVNTADHSAEEDCVQAETPRRRRTAQPVMTAEDDAPALTLPGDAEQKSRKKTGKQKKTGFRISERSVKNAQMTALLLLGAVGALLMMLARRIAALASSLWRFIRSKDISLRSIAMCVLACIALLSAFQIGSIVLRSVRTHRLNDNLAQMHAQAAETTPDAQADSLVPGSGDVLQADEMQMASADAEPAVQIGAQADAAPVQEAAEDTLPESQAVIDAVKTTKYRQVGGDALPQMASLYEQNRDLVAWLQIPDVLDLPVVYRDNSYYLKRDFYKQENASGTIFLDENHPFREKTQNLLLHGHNMKDGTMFGRLTQYLSDRTYIRNHPFINFDTLWKEEQYVIFAVLNVSLDTKDQRFFNYFTHDTFTSDAEFSAYIRQLQLRSSIVIPIDVVPSDALLTLSTCLDDDRLVIVARRLRPGETRSELRQLINMATRQ